MGRRWWARLPPLVVSQCTADHTNNNNQDGTGAGKQPPRCPQEEDEADEGGERGHSLPSARRLRLVLSSQRGQSPNCRRRSTGSKTTCWGPRRRTRRWRRRWRWLSGYPEHMSSSTRRRSSRPSPTNLTRPSLKCPVTENKNCSVLQLSLTSYLPCFFFVYFLYNSHPRRCYFYLDRHKLQATDQTLGSLDPSTSSNFTA